MSACILALGVLLGCAGPAPAFQAPDRVDQVDRWLAEDKARHFTMSFAVTALAYGAASSALDHDQAVAAGVGSAALAGLAKEVADGRAGRWFSLKDLVWDAAGVALGYLFVDRIR